MTRRSLGRVCLSAGLAAGFVIGACSSSDEEAGFGDGANGGKGGEDGIGLSLDGGMYALGITPGDTTLTVDPDDPKETILFEVSGNEGQDVQWRVVNENAGTINQQGVFTPTGRAGGVVEVQAILGDSVATATVTIIIEDTQNGGPQAGSGDPGAGGIGGVGGEGFGDSISDVLVDLLNGPTEDDADLEWLYPYDNTVFPLGILPPLMQWSEGSSGDDFEAVYVHISAPPYYDYKGYFGRPSPLGNNDSFVRHPIPKEVWEAATLTAAGEDLTVEIVVAANGTAYGPIEQTWKVAFAPVTGRIYYQAYGTALAENWSPDLTVAGGRFGGATLAINVGAESPELVAGTTTDDRTGCRVCHSVSAFGDVMVVQHGDEYDVTSRYDLKNGNTETTPYQDGTVGWAGIYPDGSIGLANSIDVTGSNSNSGDTALYDMTTGAVIASPGLNEFATQIGLPIFSPDGTKVAFTFFEGPSTPEIGNANGRKLVAMGFDLATSTFSDPVLLYESTAGDERPAWATFTPSSEAVVFQRRWDGSNSDTFSTWYGATGELWWVPASGGTAAALDAANGIGPNGQLYIPTGPNGHGEDDKLNYEPSISPVASGGYAWMVFVSRRLYGNVATMGPWESDPRDHNLIENITTKKLWMAAIDLDPEPGEDPSHPAFYIPGQEIHGTNSRPFFALDPCVSDAGVCSTGIDCCSGFCRDGYCIPPPTNECAELNEKCDTADDCCDPTARCIGGFCARILQ